MPARRRRRLRDLSAVIKADPRRTAPTRSGATCRGSQCIARFPPRGQRPGYDLRSMCGEASTGSNRGMSHTEIRPAADPVVTVRGLTKSYGGRMVVDHLDADVHAGQIVGLIGANGAGKTTTVEILQGLRRADAGEIRVLGLDPAKDADRLRPQIRSQLQSSGLPDRLGVGEVIRLFAGPRATTATSSWSSSVSPSCAGARSPASAAAVSSSDSSCGWHCSTIPGWSSSTSSPKASTRPPAPSWATAHSDQARAVRRDRRARRHPGVAQGHSRPGPLSRPRRTVVRGR
jgi:hypothetical protein